MCLINDGSVVVIESEGIHVKFTCSTQQCEDFEAKLTPAHEQHEQ